MQICLTRLAGLALLGGLPCAGLADNHNWERLTGEQALTEFMSDVRLEADFGDGMKSVATYKADGTGYMESWNGRFNRTWTVKGGLAAVTTGSTAYGARNAPKPGPHGSRHSQV